MWWLIMDQHIEYFMNLGLQLGPQILTNSITPIDMRLSLMMKRHGSAYYFSELFSYSTLRILIRGFKPRLNKRIIDELQVGEGDWYFLKNHMVVIRYGFFEAPFLLSKHPLEVLASLEMARQVAIIEKKFGSGGNLKIIYNVPTTIGTITLLDVDCVDEIRCFIVDNFIISRIQDLRVYDLLRAFA